MSAQVLSFPSGNTCRQGSPSWLHCCPAEALPGRQGIFAASGATGHVDCAQGPCLSLGGKTPWPYPAGQNVCPSLNVVHHVTLPPSSLATTSA